MNLAARSAFVGLLALGGGCNHVFSPPARIVNAESAAPVKPGETVVGGRAAAFGALFGSDIMALGGGVRHGVAPDVELNGEATYGRVEPVDAVIADRNAFAAHAGLKAGRRAVSFTTGVGGGYVGATGSFMAADFGVILSLPNCYVVPFLSPSAYVSAPLRAKTVTFNSGESSTPGATYGYGFSVGLEIELQPSVCRDGHTPPRLQIAMSEFTATSDGPATNAGGQPVSGRSYDGGLGFALGLEFPLRF